MPIAIWKDEVLTQKQTDKETSPSTQESQYNIMLDYQRERGLEQMGLMSSQCWYDDPRRMTFMLSRYKFVSKMFSGLNHVLEVGCGDAFATRIVAQEVEKVTVTDFDPLFVEDVKARNQKRWHYDAFVHDMLAGPVPLSYDGVYALDVLEHIEAGVEKIFLKNMLSGLASKGVAILGMPSLESQDYASPISKEGHVNCKTMPDLKGLMEDFFDHVFMFSMNDEVVHTGYHKMAHYLFALCCGKKG